MDSSNDLRREPIQPIESGRRLVFHADDYLDRFVAAALHLLENTGVSVLSEDALSIFGGHGARVDAQKHRVWLPQDIVRRAIASAPRSFVLAARDSACDLDLASGRTFMTADGSGVEVIDWRTGRRRPSTRDDLADATRMLDYLPSISFWWPIVSAGDCGASAPLHEIEVAWKNTVKHVQGMVQGRRAAELAVEMASVLAGGREELRRRPLLSNLIGTVSPLTIDREAAEAALVFAEAGVPLVLVSAPALGTTAPASRAGAIVLGLAEIMAIVALVQLAYPGAPVIGYLLPVNSDPRTGATTYGQLDMRDPALQVDLIHRLGLPSLTGAGGCDADLPGSWAAAAQAAPSLTMAALTGSELAVGLGLTATSMLWSPESLVLDDELYELARHMALEIPTGDEDFALDLIAEVGPGGHFLKEKHTRAHMNDAFVRGLTLQASASGGYRDPVEVARERALDILSRYSPEALDATSSTQIHSIVLEADAELRSETPHSRRRSSPSHQGER